MIRFFCLFFFLVCSCTCSSIFPCTPQVLNYWWETHPEGCHCNNCNNYRKYHPKKWTREYGGSFPYPPIIFTATDFCLNHVPFSLPKNLELHLLSFLPKIDTTCVECTTKKTIYFGYIDPRISAYLLHTRRQLEYSKQYTNCSCYWPEQSSKMYAIQYCASLDIARLFRDTALSKITKEPLEEQQKLLGNSERITNLNDLVRGISTGDLLNALLSRQFLFSDYFQLYADLENYALQKYSLPEVSAIKDILDDSLVPCCKKKVD